MRRLASGQEYDSRGTHLACHFGPIQQTQHHFCHTMPRVGVMPKVVECKDVTTKTHHFCLRVKHNPMASDVYVRPLLWFVGPCIHGEANMPTSGLDSVS